MFEWKYPRAARWSRPGESQWTLLAAIAAALLVGGSVAFFWMAHDEVHPVGLAPTPAPTAAIGANPEGPPARKGALENLEKVRAPRAAPEAERLHLPRIEGDESAPEKLPFPRTEPGRPRES